jgi:hypothetical protein
MLQVAYGNEALNCSSVFDWFRPFKDGCKDFQDDPRRGRSSASRNADTNLNISEIVTRDRRRTLRMLSDE